RPGSGLIPLYGTPARPPTACRLPFGAQEAGHAPPPPHLPVTPPRHARRDPPRHREGRRISTRRPVIEGPSLVVHSTNVSLRRRPLPAAPGQCATGDRRGESRRPARRSRSRPVTGGIRDPPCSHPT